MRMALLCLQALGGAQDIRFSLCFFTNVTDLARYADSYGRCDPYITTLAGVSRETVGSY
jgi:hypothetical protein